MSNLLTKKACFFSLIELMVVLSVLAILLTLIQPSLRKTYESTKRIQCSSNYKLLHLAFETYVQDFEKYPIALTNIEGSNVGGLTWDDQLALGYDGRNLPIKFVSRFGIEKEQIGTEQQRQTYQCPIIKDQREESVRAARTYAYNVAYRSGINEGFSNYWSRGVRWSAGINDVPSPGTTLILAEITWGDMSAAGGAGMPNYRSQPVHGATHFGEYNYLFADGHSESMLREDTGWNRLYWTRDSSD